MIRRAGLTALCLCALACSKGVSNSAGSTASHSSSIALSSDGRALYVANADLDSISVIDPVARVLKGEILLGASHPSQASDGGSYTPLIQPRALAVSPDGSKVYVTGERSGLLYEISTATNAVARTVAICSEPAGVVVARDGRSAYAACSQDSSVVKIDADAFAVTATAAVSFKPWALCWSSDQSTGTDSLYATHLLGPGVTKIDPSTMTASAVSVIPDTAPRGDKRLAHGQVRGIYDAVPRPGSTELWTAHLLLATDTAQPSLNFESTAFAAFSILGASTGSFAQTLSINASDVAGVNGSINDVVSGPHALAFTRDGNYALLIDSNSADLLAIDARTRHESSLLRPLPGKMPEGIAVSPDGKFAFVDERNSNDVAAVQLDQSSGKLVMSLVGNPIPRSAADPMPAQLRLGQHLFYSADSSEYPITKDHWIACASCHVEGRSDAVTWNFEEGPRDTPSNAGGTSASGFLFRTADRRQVQDYWHTINIEAGGNFAAYPTDADQAVLLDAMAAYVNQGIPLPIPPTTNAALVAQGKEIFNRPAVGCAVCHYGPALTDSGAGNPTLSLSGTVLLHDVGTCNTGVFPDVAHFDVAGHARAACLFDTPSLNGLADSAPYLHDGSAATLKDVLEKTRGKMGDISSLSAGEEAALVEYLRSL